jgi:hypothetical protein
MDNKLKNRKTLKRGSRRQVWNGSAEKTMGGLGKDDLMKNERGRIVSKKKCTTMKNSYKGSDDEEEDPDVRKSRKILDPKLTILEKLHTIYAQS